PSGRFRSQWTIILVLSEGGAICGNELQRTGVRALFMAPDACLHRIVLGWRSGSLLGALV
ncbi:TPA: hypothetical protein ACSPZ9_004406, partial [Aeromonas hydrophila]